MKLYTDVKSKNRPLELDLESSTTAIYENSNIRVESINVGHTQVNGKMTDLYQNMYIYDTMKYTREEWIFEMLKRLNYSLIDPIIDPTADLDTIIYLKGITIKNGCTRKINSGIDVELNGVTEHYSLTPQDQINIDNITSKIIGLNMTKVIFNSDDSYARLYTNQEFLTVSLKAKEFILRETTYCNYMINYIKTLTEEDRDLLLSIKYGDSLPIQLDSEYNELVDTELAEYKERINSHFNIVI